MDKTSCLAVRKEDILKLSNKNHAAGTAALYCRLSRDDNLDTESNSISNQENICQGGFHHKNEIPPVKLGLVSQNKVYHIYPTQQSVKNGPPNRVPSRITNYHCQSAAKCDTCLYCFFDSFSFLFIHVYVSSPKFRFIELTRAKYTTNANDIQPSFIGVDSTGKQGTGIYPAQLVGG